MSLVSLREGMQFFKVVNGLKATRTPFLVRILAILWEMPATKGREMNEEESWREEEGGKDEQKKALARLKAREICLGKKPFQMKTWRRWESSLSKWSPSQIRKALRARVLIVPTFWLG